MRFKNKSFARIEKHGADYAVIVNNNPVPAKVSNYQECVNFIRANHYVKVS